ncbi:MAG: RNA polymerase subunit sigma-70 [Ignavibacteriales bacterium CG_4_9_14_3_um_filter_34_10]|nr:MAG: RNA polymerase subunit sigma-70 [Ignavibacteriales bacterium CG_4_9_14_3_um_filter_34_10]
MELNENLSSLNEEQNITEFADPDFKLIREYINGNENAFAKLVGQHKDKVRNLVYLTLGDADYVDDISQDVFISVFNKIKEFRFESKFTTWLYRITVNKCKDYLRKKKVRSIFTPISESHYEIGAKFNQENQDIPTLVRKAIDRLPDKLKIPLLLRDIEGLSYKEIAVQLECEVGTIKSRIFRARENLKIILEPFQKELNY